MCELVVVSGGWPAPLAMRSATAAATRHAPAQSKIYGVPLRFRRGRSNQKMQRRLTSRAV